MQASTYGVHQTCDRGVQGHRHQRVERTADDDAQQHVDGIDIAPAVKATEAAVKWRIVGQCNAHHLAELHGNVAGEGIAQQHRKADRQHSQRRPGSVGCPGVGDVPRLLVKEIERVLQLPQPGRQCLDPGQLTVHTVQDVDHEGQ